MVVGRLLYAGRVLQFSRKAVPPYAIGMSGAEIREIPYFPLPVPSVTFRLPRCRSGRLLKSGVIMSRLRNLPIYLLSAVATFSAHAVSCGTVAAATTCSVTIANKVKYTFNNFALVSSTGSGGGNVYQAGDIAIDAATGGGNTGLVTFSKLQAGPTPGVAFLANAGNVSAFTMSYQVTIEPLGAAGVVFSSPFVLSVSQQSHIGNGLGTVQFIVPGASVCQAFASAGNTQANCVIPGGQAASLTVGQTMNLSGNIGNVSIGSFSNLFDIVTARGQGLDVDGNGAYNASTDGLLVARYLLGLRGTALISGAIGAGATRTSASSIEQYLFDLLP